MRLIFYSLLPIFTYAAVSIQLGNVNFRNTRNFKFAPAPYFLSSRGEVLGDEVELSRVDTMTLFGSKTQLINQVDVSLMPLDENRVYKMSVSAVGLGGYFLIEDQDLEYCFMDGEDGQTEANAIYQIDYRKQTSLILFIRREDADVSQLQSTLNNAIIDCEEDFTYQCLFSHCSHLVDVLKYLEVHISTPPNAAQPQIQPVTVNPSEEFVEAWRQHDIETMFRIARQTPSFIPIHFLRNEQTILSTLLSASEWRRWLKLVRGVYLLEQLQQFWVQTLLFFLRPNYYRGVPSADGHFWMPQHFHETIQEFALVTLSPQQHHLPVLKAIAESDSTRLDHVRFLRAWFTVYGRDLKLCSQLVQSSSLIAGMRWAQSNMCGWAWLKGYTDNCSLSLQSVNEMLRIEGELEMVPLDTQRWQYLYSLDADRVWSMILTCLQQNLHRLLIVLLAMVPQHVRLEAIHRLSLRQLVIFLKRLNLDDDFLQRMSHLSLAHEFAIRLYRRFQPHLIHLIGACGVQPYYPDLVIDVQELETMMEPKAVQVTPDLRDDLNFNGDTLTVPFVMAYLLTGMSFHHATMLSDNETWDAREILDLINLRNQHYCRERDLKPLRLLLLRNTAHETANETKPAEELGDGDHVIEEEEKEDQLLGDQILDENSIDFEMINLLVGLDRRMRTETNHLTQLN